VTTLQIPHAFDFHQEIGEVILVGTGGTGSQVARTLCRIVYDMRRRGQHIPTLRFVDPDTVEAKNVGRQMFTEADIGQYKAAVLSSRFNLAMGLGITAYTEPFDAEKHVSRYGSLVIGCVDNHLARQALSQTNGLWLDCGNHQSSGQVTIGNSDDWQVVKSGLKRGQYTHLPNAALLFPQLLQPEPTVDLTPVPTPTASCADLVAAGEQALLVNDMVGIVAGEYLYKLLNRLPVTTFLTYVDTESLSMRSVPITMENLKEFLYKA